MNKSEYDGAQYVVVNVTHPIYAGIGEPYWFPVMPGEEPHTYGTLDEAAECLADLAEEYGHTPKTALIFKLEPVPIKEVERALEQAKRRLAES